MKNTNITVSFELNGTEQEKEIDLSGLSGWDEVLTAINEDLEEGEEVETYTVTDWQEIPASFQDEEDSTIFEYVEYAEKSGLDSDIWESGYKAGISMNNIEEAYTGSYKDDEEFAEDIAEQTGCIDKNASWPMTCIDWEQAANVLMMDYTEEDGHYFRNL